MGESIGLTALFASAFLSATLLPAHSEALLAGMIVSEHFNLYALIIIATVGNVLGAVFNWLIGFYLHKAKDTRWSPVKPAMMAKATRIYNKWGTWSLLFAWVPIIGDPLTLVAGIFRTHLLLFVLLVAVGKGARYLFIASLLS